jgi:WD40-like Beta Propeller Repeat
VRALPLIGAALVASAFIAGASARVEAETAASPPRVLYASDWTGRPQIYVVDPARPAVQRQITFGGRGFVEPHPSPNGRLLAYLGSPTRPSFAVEGEDLWIAQANGLAAKRVAVGSITDVAWSPDSTRLAYRLESIWHVVRADGTGGPLVGSLPGWFRTPDVSPNGKWRVRVTVQNGAILAFGVVSARSGETLRFFDATSQPVWSPDSRRLAFTRAEGVHVADFRTGRVRRLTRWKATELTWSPDGRSLAFVEGARGYESATVHVSATGDLLTVTMSGRIRRIVNSDRAYGGTIGRIAWTKPPTTVRYKAAEPAPATRIAPLSLLAGGHISALAADGSRVAFVACGGVFAWTPATGTVIALQSQPLAVCRSGSGGYIGYSLAIAGDRVAYGTLMGCHTIDVTLQLEVLAPSRTSSTLARGRGQCGNRYAPGAGWLVGSGDLLAFSTWDEACVFPPGCSSTRYVTTSQRVHRTSDGGCPCPVIASSQGPLIPADVDSGRVLAYGDNETLLLDREGTQLLSIHVSPLAAQLSGAHLALILRGQVRHFDATTGALLHTWPLPDIASGARCEHRCARTGEEPRLIVEDLARGLVAYVLDGQVHTLRLADGADRIVANGTRARFMNAGLVYADGTRVHILPFDRLPLRRSVGREDSSTRAVGE